VVTVEVVPSGEGFWLHQREVDEPLGLGLLRGSSSSSSDALIRVASPREERGRGEVEVPRRGEDD